MSIPPDVTQSLLDNDELYDEYQKLLTSGSLEGLLGKELSFTAATDEEAVAKAQKKVHPWGLAVINGVPKVIPPAKGK